MIRSGDGGRVKNPLWGMVEMKNRVALRRATWNSNHQFVAEANNIVGDQMVLR